MKIGNTAPDFTLKDGEGNDWTLSNYKGRTVVLLFYPGDNTPVCTAQLCSVRDHWSEYQATGAEVVGISTDTVESHQDFAEKNQLPLRLLSDADRKVSEQYEMKSWLPGRVITSTPMKPSATAVQRLACTRSPRNRAAAMTTR